MNRLAPIGKIQLEKDTGIPLLRYGVLILRGNEGKITVGEFMNNGNCTKSGFDGLSELILDGSLSDIFSAQFCTKMATEFSANKAVLIRSADGPAPTVVSSGVDDSSVKAYEEYFFQIDPMNQTRSSNVALRMSDTTPKKRFEASEFYQDFFKPMDSYHSLSLMRGLGGGDSIELAVNRGVGEADYSSADKRRIKYLAALLAARVGVLEAANSISDEYRKDKTERLATLSERELQVFLSISAGNSLNEFCLRNKISVHTGRTILKAVRTKLLVDNQLELTKVARAIAR